MVYTALEAAATLADGGRRRRRCSTCAAWRRSTGTPSSTTVAKTSRVLLLHEATRTGGIGGELAAIIAEEAFDYLDAPVMRVASLDTPVPYAPAARGGFLPERRQAWSAAAKRLVKY